MGLMVSEENFFLSFFHCKSMGVNDPRALDPRGLIGKIYVEDHQTLLHVYPNIYKLWASWIQTEDFLSFSH